MPDLVLAIDIGNSAVKFGIGPRNSASWHDLWRLPTQSATESDEWASLLLPHLPPDIRVKLASVVCSSVVPLVAEALLDGLRQLVPVEPVVVTARTPMAIRVTTDLPERTGSDRIVNANTMWITRGGPSIVIDAGTATKIDAVTATGEFPGGIIAPGVGTMMDGLARRAAQLSEVPVAMPERAIGRNTATAIQSGVVLGHTRMIEGLIQDVTAELGQVVDVVMTGGFSALLAPHIPSVRAVEPTFVLDGLRHLTG
ncbi:MAG: type III pantothenate kinase [Thermomicrobiales bacterium]|nr:type III pantothenate kinase [Thermomicrobiales bacterium]